MNVQKEEDKIKMAAKKEKEDPNLTTENEDPDLMPPFVVDLLTHEDRCGEESIQSSIQCSTATNLGGWGSGGWMNTPKNWIYRTHPKTRFACFNPIQLKEEQISLSTGMHWERWPCLCLENLSKISSKTIWLRILNIVICRMSVHKIIYRNTSFIQLYGMEQL
jgi:hypothetical protein